jgi:acetylornithine/succinyldiaminopimelate/putrescine aminotransferase
VILVKAMNNRQLFLQHVAQTSESPIGIEMVEAAGVTLTDVHGKTYTDFIAGFSVCNIGHSHPEVVKAVQEQAAKYMHLIVYGEFIESPQVQYAALLASHLPQNLDCVYFTSSGAEATEGALKLAKRVTGKTKILACNKAYHGSTQGALSVMGDEYWRNAYRPLLPEVYHFNYNDDALVDAIDNTVACVIVEPVQAESGVTPGRKDWLAAIRKKCDAHCVLLIFDEIQSGFGRTGTLFAFEQMGVVPDVLLVGKALGGGMPLGAFISSHKLMSTLTVAPVLGHITTFGGHPVSCAAGKKAFEILLEQKWIDTVPAKSELLQSLLVHPAIVQMQGIGLWFSLQFSSDALAQKVAHTCVQNGVITDWFLFAPNCIRVAPPLIITEAEIRAACTIILQSIDQVLLEHRELA